ncbi:MAG: cytidine deaminase [Gammaproteobacteria bacterium RIFCSPHIGHO2_12_FULL_42_10]|nr:MAG: cytidine deaminase [Gammaproteobacteria bacterium RIFCSPHIGHO2_12_FULL_42_10]
MLKYMYQQAILAKKNAHAPYSKYFVGCCLRTNNNLFFCGCNVENTAYPSTQCAEVSAIGAMVTAGEKTIAEIVIVGGNDQLCTPCGNCRQVIGEFGAETTQVHIMDDHGLQRTFLLGELLPHPFNPDISSYSVTRA